MDFPVSCFEAHRGGEKVGTVFHVVTLLVYVTVNAHRRRSSFGEQQR